MAILSLILAVIGTILMLIHYATHSIALGILTAIALIAAYIIGTREMKRQRENGGIPTNVFNPALLGHGFSSVVFVVCGIMCLIAVIAA